VILVVEAANIGGILGEVLMGVYHRRKQAAVAGAAPEASPVKP
jgi:hypothetical protein